MNARRWSGAVEMLARSLHPDQRDSVLGDCHELGLSSGQTCRELVGLLARQHARPCLQVQTWLAVLGIAIPAGVVLGHVSRQWADRAAIDAWMYVHNWTDAFLDSPGARRDLVKVAIDSALRIVSLASWAAVAGYALGRLWPSGRWIAAISFVAMLFAATAGTITIARANPFNAAAFSGPTYVTALLLVVRLGFVLLPFLLGSGVGARQHRPSLGRALAVAGIVLLLTWRAAPSVELSFYTGRLSPRAVTIRAASPHDPLFDPLLGGPGSVLRRWMLPLLLAWPAGYLAAISLRRKVGHSGNFQSSVS